MKSLLTIAILIVGIASFGCGNPCQEGLTDIEIDVLVSATESARDMGLSKTDALLVFLDECRGVLACRECSEWVINTVYP